MWEPGRARIALVVHGWPPESAGGTGLYVGALARALRARGHAVVILSPSALPGIHEDTQGHVRIGGRPPSRWEETWRRPEVDALVRAWMRRWRPDVVHLHHLAWSSWGISRVARQEGALTALTLHDYAIPCARGQLLDRDLHPCPGPTRSRCATCLSDQLRLDPATARVGRALRRWPGLRWRAREEVGRLPPRPRDLSRVSARLRDARDLLLEVDLLLSPSADLARRVEALGFRTPEVLDLPLVRPVPPAPPAPTGVVRFLYASAVIPSKGPQILVDAFARLPAGAARLTVAGPCPAWDGHPDFAGHLRERVLALPGARWLGDLPPGQIPALLVEHDVLVLPSIWPENSPLVVREATAAGLRVVVSEVGGARELAPAAATVAPGDTDALFAVLAHEARVGRGRMPPARWPTPDEHAAVLEARYRAAALEVRYRAAAPSFSPAPRR